MSFGKLAFFNSDGVFLLLCLAIMGCAETPQPQSTAPPPKATIRVETSESSEGKAIIILYFDHHRVHWHENRYYRDTYHSISTVEEAIRYEKELQFALTQVQELQKRMEVREQHEKSPE